ncbi:RB1-inducible coiled-coil protein 1-like isoform X1 [Anopheles albimanus]|uniref:RB1-inducible coiled-coil protein 1-like isoform X1 n=1 Tax=Anopheles albimanus TaxID=7167 RepID=UPI0016420694|nr:RB1-inducible coiled-coil protein 1-like isoform X1 [Anopheles albimanus]XP_035795460.1 RB1-inducible coiled-coil protein 1-like isoform X1 [Anopheles albimanus]XP_035795461.1 RB1-inducible coiled-coil protein 1-like isoform X1 [Anopheles albimanus]XP_035795462.1 RB1-inducible coiled-coil protein 1-like isoform X1 [Anopheles albimanus]XP_035795463.1 RB1-inducible coiled-coil protein 1-like isoform X1 [Anopheles albimanus]XP_035795464.1 RB1-inducible coiled-coil protein 1-like isoform X1 [An
MMYVFHVDQGRMLTFEMNWMFEDIRKLKEVIERHHAIPARSIVLLVSGGEMLVNDSRVCNYATGTDTNPIYMFSTNTDELLPPSPGPSNTEVDVETLVHKSCELPVAYATVVSRAQLAQKICEMAREEFKRCEALVHEQHLQQQGWAAVVANMEDTVKEFTERCDNFFRYYEEHLRLRAEHVGILRDFDKNLQQLADIPILSTLMEHADSRPYGVFDEVFHRSSVTAASGSAGSTSRVVSSSGINQTQQAAVTAGQPTVNGEPTKADGDKNGQETAGMVGGSSSSTEPAVATDTEQATLTDVERAKGISLLDWISASEGQLTLKRMAEECRIELEKFDQKLLDTFNDRIGHAVNLSQNNEIKVVKGLEERLCGLDQLLADARKIVQDQNELAQSIQMNQTRANNLGDASVLPDLCTLHQKHLLLMLENHNKMCEYRRRCTQSKDQLSSNISKRLTYIIRVETKVSEHDNYMLFYRTSLKRLQKHLSIIEQIHMAPTMYVSAVTEVVRRRMFSSSFLRWASDLACRLMAIYNEEVMRRQEFTAQFEGHFLSTLFPGMSDLPPSYAIQAPSVFDSSLPALDKQDLEELSRFLPELTEQNPLPNIASVIDFFQTRSVEQQQQQQQQNSSNSMNKDETSGSDASKSNDSKGPSNVARRHGSDQSITLGAYRIDARSEVDMEEFEKVHNQTNIERQDEATQVDDLRTPTCSVATSTDKVEQVCVETLTEDNLGTTRLEVERLKALVRSFHDLSLRSISVLREQLANVRSESAANRAQFQAQLLAINQAWHDIQQVARNRERETIQQLTVDHELEMNDLRKSIHQKDEEIQSLRSDNSTMKASQIETVSSYEQEKRQLSEQITEMREVIGRLECQLAEAVGVDRQKAIEEAVQQLEKQHRSDMETLRCRYKLMASVDKSPSDTSLEKIEKPDMIDLAVHEQLLAQAREDLGREKERAIKAAIEEERHRWEKNAIASGSNRLQRSYAGGSSPGTTPTGSQDVYKRILEEKDRQLEELREKEALLVRENMRMKETIQSLSDPELSMCDVNYREQLEALETDRQRLNEELDGRREEVCALLDEKQSLARELDKHRKDSAQLVSCSEGDTVSFVWNPAYTQYTVMQASEFLYFLHESSYAELGLQALVPGEIPRVTFGIGTVIHKEFCHARRDDNRYRVARGTRFYRIKLKPVNLNRKSKGRSSKSSSSGGIGTRTMESSLQQQPDRAVVVVTTIPSSTQVNRLIDSFAQTEVPSATSTLITTTSLSTATVATTTVSSGTTLIGSPGSPTGSSRDMTDSGVVRSSYRERNISITDDDDIPPVIGSDGSIDRIRYQSVCEEDDPTGGDDDGDDEELTTDNGTGGGGSATQDHLSHYKSATDTSIVTVRTELAVVDTSLIAASTELSFGNISNETSVSSSSASHHQHQHHLLYATNNPPAIVPDDVSDSADSEYRSLEANDPEDESDSVAVPPPLPASKASSTTP